MAPAVGTVDEPVFTRATVLWPTVTDDHFPRADISGPEILGRFPGTADIFNCADQEVDNRIQERYGNSTLFWGGIESAEYVLWPIDAGNGHFVTAILHMEKEAPKSRPQENESESIVVESWSVIDPERGVAARARVNRVRGRIQRIMALQGIVFKNMAYRENTTGIEPFALPWVPQLTEPWSTGHHSFVLIRELFRRIVNFHCFETGFRNSFFNDHTSGWLNVDQVRHEIMGISAVMCIDDMGWRAQIAIEPIEQIQTPGQSRSSVIFDANRLAPLGNDTRRAWVPGADEVSRVKTTNDGSKEDEVMKDRDWLTDDTHETTDDEDITDDKDTTTEGEEDMDDDEDDDL
ncbi:hypothetical protein F4779DRAFT_614659 [Xylariaceae sp. FL0662B]|nr:hypothetical protein F4779DRAFT_614659 [Xylariaceae sp. FL0662B]